MQATEKPILIASSAIDCPTYANVVYELNRLGFRCVVYESDAVLSGADHFSSYIDEQGELSVQYNGESIAPNDIAAAWYRKIGNFDLPYNEGNIARRQYINNEVRALHHMIWSAYPDDVWLNAPEVMHRAEGKFLQAIVAKRIGFNVLKTLITSSWDEVDNEFLSTDRDKVAIKMLRGIINEGEDLHAMYTTAVEASRIGTLKAQTFAFPAHYQQFMEKRREWRITAVGDKIFPAAIYTEKDAKVDWRKHQTASSVRFVKESAPEDIEERCVKYLGTFGLKYGAFDFIETVDGELLFLECNPNGQYAWIEDGLGLPISNAIAVELAGIARSAG